MFPSTLRGLAFAPTILFFLFLHTHIDHGASVGLAVFGWPHNSLVGGASALEKSGVETQRNRRSRSVC
jgi:hypothetical protein